MSYQVIFTDQLYHHGIKGQKWGVRRFRNEDGSLTNAGKERYRDDSKTKTKDTVKKVAIGAGIAGTVALGAYVVHKNRQYIRNKAAKRQIEIGKKNVSKFLSDQNQASMNYNFFKALGDSKGARKEKIKMKQYGKLAKKTADQYPRKAYKLKTGSYKNANKFLLENHKPVDYLGDFATGGVLGLPIGVIVGQKIYKKKNNKTGGKE